MIYADDISKMCDRCVTIVRLYLNCNKDVVLEGNQEDVLWEKFCQVLDKFFDYPDYQNYNQ